MKELLYRIAAGVEVNPGDVPNIPPAGDGLRQSDITNILQVVFGVAGAIAVIIMVLAGLKYVTSMGDPASTAKARNAIIYAAIGMAVCVAAFSIVRFVVEGV